MCIIFWCFTFPYHNYTCFPFSMYILFKLFLTNPSWQTIIKYPRYPLTDNQCPIDIKKKRNKKSFGRFTGVMFKIGSKNSFLIQVSNILKSKVFFSTSCKPYCTKWEDMKARSKVRDGRRESNNHIKVKPSSSTSQRTKITNHHLLFEEQKILARLSC